MSRGEEAGAGGRRQKSEEEERSWAEGQMDSGMQGHRTEPVAWSDFSWREGTWDQALDSTHSPHGETPQGLCSSGSLLNGERGQGWVRGSKMRGDGSGVC